MHIHMKNVNEFTSDSSQRT